MKKPIADGTPATSAAIDENISVMSEKRKKQREGNRSHWKTMSDLEILKQRATIAHYDRLQRQYEQSLVLEKFLVESLIGKPVNLPPVSVEDEKMSNYWNSVILPTVFSDVFQEGNVHDDEMEVESLGGGSGRKRKRSEEDGGDAGGEEEEKGEEGEEGEVEEKGIYCYVCKTVKWGGDTDSCYALKHNLTKNIFLMDRRF